MRILLIAPAFYDYHQHIVSTLESQGHEVRFFAERPDRWLYSPAKRLPLRLRQAVFDRYLRNILRATDGEAFDKVLLIRGEIVRPWFVQALRQQQPGARFVMYQWDSYRVTDFRLLVPLFDAVSTFDKVDAQELGVGYLPLFHIPGYRLKDAPVRPEWDLVFVGSFHAARYRTLVDIREHCNKRGIRLRHYLYIAPIDYYKLKLFFRQAPVREDVEFRKLDQAAVVDLYRSATGILDIENNKQTGLTMRSFEALATGRLLVTTNPLASELLPELVNRIVTIDRLHLDLPVERLRHAPGWDEDLMAWSIEAWATHLLNM